MNRNKLGKDLISFKVTMVTIKLFYLYLILHLPEYVICFIFIFNLFIFFNYKTKVMEIFNFYPSTVQNESNLLFKTTLKG